MVNSEVPATVGQRLLWMMDRRRSGYGALNCPVVCRIRGPLDVALLGAALDLLTSRHEAMRTTFAGRGHNLTQVIQDPRPLELRQFDVSGDAAPAASIRQAIKAELAARIDVSRWPVRVTLWRAAAAEHVLCVNMHHLVTDAWSAGIVFQELVLLLGQPAGVNCVLPAEGWQYRQFADYQRQLLAGDGLRRHREYWLRQLADAQLPALRTDLTQADPNAAGSGVAHAEIDVTVTRALRRLATQEGVTLFSVMLSVEYALLHSLTGQTDLAVGSLFANRSKPELRRTVGFLANMVVLRTRFPETATFSELVHATQRTLAGAFAYQELPYQLLPPRTIQAGSQRVDDIVFHLVGDPGYHSRAGELEIEMLVPEDMGGRFKCELVVVQHGDKFSALLFYNRDWIEPGRAAEIVSGYARLAAAAVAAPADRLAHLCGG